MNCPNCGADNETEARFCVECGTPLENQLDAASSLEEGDDLTIISQVSAVAEDAKTVSVTQDDVAAASAEPEVEAEPPPPPSPPLSRGGSDGGQGWANQRNLIIIAIVVLIILCCCCGTLGVAATAGSDVINDIIYELGM